MHSLMIIEPGLQFSNKSKAMSDTPFRDELRQITSAAIDAQRAYATYSGKQREIDLASAQRLAIADNAASAQRQWAAEQTKEIAASVVEGMSRLPGEIDPGLRPPTPEALLADSRIGLETAAKKARTNANGLQEGSRALSLWRAKRSSLMGVMGIGAVAAMVLIGALIFWLVFQARAERAAATQTVVTFRTGPTLTAGAATAIAITHEAQETIAVVSADATTTVANEPNSTEQVNSPATTPRPPTRTPRPPPTPGPTPTSLPPGAIVCIGALPTRITVGGKARVINYQLNVRAGPGTNHSVVRRLDPGRTMDVLDGPVCDDGQLWYYVLSEEIVPRDGSQPYRVEGWLVEESGGTYYLESLQ